FGGQWSILAENRRCRAQATLCRELSVAGMSAIGVKRTSIKMNDAATQVSFFEAAPERPAFF
ncbi:MAG: hypothetical protein WCE72_12435, partial [Pseudolabrys sp.]